MTGERLGVLQDDADPAGLNPDAVESLTGLILAELLDGRLCQNQIPATIASEQETVLRTTVLLIVAEFFVEIGSSRIDGLSRPACLALD